MARYLFRFVKLHATGVKLEARLADQTQAVCADRKIHHRP
jgi:hypothetical protein